MSVDDFFLVLEKSSLLAAEQIQAARQQAAGESDPKVVARKLLSDGLLTKWQARQLLHGRYALTMGPYKLLDQSVGDGVARTFLVQHGKSGQKAELRSLSRSHAAESPEAIEQFVAAAEQVSAAENRKLFEVHRPETSDDTCYVVLEEALGGVLPGTATDLSNSAVADTSTTAEVAQTAQPNREKKADPVVEQPGAQEAANARPPKLKAKARSVTATAATSASDAPASQDKPVSQDKPAGPPPAAEPSNPAIEIKLPGQEAPDVAPAAPREFKIATGKRRKKPSAAPAGRSAKPEGAEGTEGTEATGDEQAASVATLGRVRSPAVWIGGMVAGGLLLVGGVVLAWVLFSRGGGSQVADGATGAAQQTAEEGQTDNATPGKAKAPPDSEPADPVMDPEITVEVVAAESSEPQPDSTVASAAAAEVFPPAASVPEMVEASESSAAQPTEPSETPAAQGPAAPAPAAKADATASPPEAEMEPAKAEPAAEQPAEEPKADEPAKKKTPAPPPGKKPFADLKDIATLPEVGSTQPKALGPVYVPPGEVCFVRLRGGENAFRGTQRFVIKNARDGLEEREWDISVREASGTETVVASLALDDKNQMLFQWKPEAKSPALETISPHFRNCVFSLSCAGDSKIVILREPAAGEPLSVDLDKAAGSKNDWKIDQCPNPDVVRFQITGIQGMKFSLDPAEPQPADKATVWLRIEEGGGMLFLKLDASLKRDFLLTAIPHIKILPDAPKHDKFIKRVFQNNIKELETRSEFLKQRVKTAQGYAKSAAKDAKQVEQQLPNIEFEAKTADELLQNMKKIDDLLKTVEGGMKINFRVYYDADSTEVTLLKAG
jgi:hypothetical protein